MDNNVFGETLMPCSHDPMTGFFRDGCCNTAQEDIGVHTVCAVVDEDFLEFTKQQGNDLTTARPGFKGLKAGDRWCLCASRWLEAYEAGVAPKVVLEATNEKTLEHIPMDTLIACAYTTNEQEDGR